MHTISTLRLYVLRAMYLLLAVGMGLTVWPLILAPTAVTTDASSVLRAMLGALSALALLGLRYPMRMLPLLLFELAWKAIWLVAFALPAWLGGQLDAKASGTASECLIGVVLVLLAIPWSHVFRHYVREPAEPWRSTAAVRDAAE